MNRRSLLKALSALVLPGALEDPERLNWRKGAKVFSFAAPSLDLPPLRSELIQTTKTELIVKPSTEFVASFTNTEGWVRMHQSVFGVMRDAGWHVVFSTGERRPDRTVG